MALSVITITLKSVLIKLKTSTLCKLGGSKIYSRQQNAWGSSALILPYHPSDFMCL